MQQKKLNTSNRPIPEHFLFWTYDNLKFLKSPFRTWSGQSLEILEAGKPNYDNGPDYLNALLKIADIKIRGDIEFHVNWQEWFRHGHDDDRRYERVILHILWEPPVNAPQLLLERFPHFVISEFLTCSHQQWYEAMRRLNFHSSDSHKFPNDVIPDNFRFKKFAWQRFERRCQEIRQWVDEFGWENTVFLGLAKVLGYSKNSQPFVELVKMMPPTKLVTRLRPSHRLPHIYWYILGRLSGLIKPENYQNQIGIPDAPALPLGHLYQQYQHIFPLRSQDIVQWTFARLRPQNNPYFRLAGYSQLIYQFQNDSLFNQLTEAFSGRFPLSAITEKVQKRLLIPLNHNFHPLLKQLVNTCHPPKQTMGAHRCNLYQLNFLLPLFYLWARVNSSFGFARYIEDLYFHFPVVDDNSILRSISESPVIPSEMCAYHHQAILEYFLFSDTSMRRISQKGIDSVPNNS